MMVNFHIVNNVKAIKPLFEKFHQSLLLAYWQGNIGYAYTDNALQPYSAVVSVGCFFFCADCPNQDMLSYTPTIYNNNYFIVIADDQIWQSLIERTYPSSYQKLTRYSFYFEPLFKGQMLQAIVSKLSEDYQLEAIDENNYQQITSLKWSKHLCNNFNAYSALTKYGLGCVILKDNINVSGASSYLAYDNGIEIDVDTLAQQRWKGLGLICSAKLILTYLERLISPKWDAHKHASLKMTTKLGFKPNKSYQAYTILNS